MREHVRLGRVAGVSVGINWSVLVIFVLITFGLAAGRFPSGFPGLDQSANVVAGLATGVLFFLSLLAHEVSHAVVAQRNDVEVEGITCGCSAAWHDCRARRRVPGSSCAPAR